MVVLLLKPRETDWVGLAIMVEVLLPMEVLVIAVLLLLVLIIEGTAGVFIMGTDTLLPPPSAFGAPFLVVVVAAVLVVVVVAAALPFFI